MNNLLCFDIIDAVVEGVVFVALLIIVLRAALVRKPVEKADRVSYNIDAEKVKKHLSDAIKIPTVSPRCEGDNSENFTDFEKFLEKTYPALHARAEKTVINEHALVFKIYAATSLMEKAEKTATESECLKEATEKTEETGVGAADSDGASVLSKVVKNETQDGNSVKTEKKKPIAFLAHQDVVPAKNDGWNAGPFDGEIKTVDGEEYVYGRGALDMKGQIVSVLEAVEYLIKSGFEFNRDVYLCFGFDEELTGTMGALQIVKHLEKENVKFEFLIDEGGIVLDGGLLGTDKKIALIGNSEKGYVDLLLTAECDGGHSSAPVHPTSVEMLSKAVYKLSKHPFKPRITQSVKDLIDVLTPHIPFVYRLICANRGIFAPVIKKILFKIHPAVGAALQTTMAPTEITGSDAPNTISKKASVNVNFRILEGDTEESVIKHVRKIVGGDIKIERRPNSNYDKPGSASSIKTESYKTVAKSVKETFENLIPAPFTFIAGSDAKYYYPVAEHIYRFTPFPISPEDADRIHGIDERVKVKDLVPAVSFFIRVIENAN